MKTRILSIALALILIMLCFPAIAQTDSLKEEKMSNGKKPQSTPIVVTQERILSCGYACDPNDGCIGDDEHWWFAATGDIGPGESYIYVAPEPLCHAYGKIKVIASTRKKGMGQPPLIVTLDVWDTEYQWQNEGVGLACIIPPSGDGHGMKYWMVTVTNTHSRKTATVWIEGYVNGTSWVSNRCP